MTKTPERIAEIVQSLATGRVIETQQLRIYHVRIDGQPVSFCGAMRRDPIQRSHRNGRFYEHEELALLSRLLPAQATILDIGANVGNHTLFFAKMMNARLVVPFEPNPAAYELLIAHVLINGIAGQVDLRHLGIGLSDRDDGGFGMEERHVNLGMAKMLPGKGDIALARADTLLGDIRPDLIKVDVEGMEIGVLKGLGDIPVRSRCLMYIEVDNENADAFAAWRDARGLVTVHTHRRYRTSMYHFVIHADRASEMSERIGKLVRKKENAENQ